MESHRIAHLSDLHIGLGPDAAAEALVEATLRAGATRVVVTGDITHRGLQGELARFRRIFAPLSDRGLLVVIPGNHDRLGDDLEDSLMHGPRAQLIRTGSLWMVRFNSTGPHNRRWLEGHGLLTLADLEAIASLFHGAPEDATRVLLLHHHPLPLRDEHVFEKLVTKLGWPNAAELPLGAQLLERLRGRCDLVLHGHRHFAAERTLWPEDARPLRALSGGSSTLLGGFRLLDEPAGASRWVSTQPALPQAPARRLRAHRDAGGRAPVHTAVALTTVST